MATDLLIDRLVADARPTRRRSIMREAALVAGVALAELAVFLLGGVARPDMMHAAAMPMMGWKLASLALLATLGTATALASLTPDRSPRRGLGLIAAAVVGAVAVGLVLGMRQPMPGDLLTRLNPAQGLECLVEMVLLSLPVAGALGWLARRGGSTDLGGTALACGVGAGGWGAFVFAFACPSDDPLYIVIWYLIGCGTVALGARLMLARLIRW